MVSVFCVKVRTMGSGLYAQEQRAWCKYFGKTSPASQT